MRISKHDSVDTMLEQMGLRYNRTYTTTRKGTAVHIIGMLLEGGVDNEDPEDEPVLSIEGRTRGSRTITYKEEDIEWDVWPDHHVLFHSAWGGVMVWEKRPERQIKKLPCDSSMRIVTGSYINHPLDTENGWYDIVSAMRSPQYNDVETARTIIKDNEWKAFPISPNAYITADDVVYYHGLPLGTLDEARAHRLWRIIQKEAA